jgi:hypothetical protein
MMGTNRAGSGSAAGNKAKGKKPRQVKAKPTVRAKGADGQGESRPERAPTRFYSEYKKRHGDLLTAMGNAE